MKRKKLIIMYDNLNTLMCKGEIKRRYYNPCNYFDEIHVFVRNYDKAKKNLDLYKDKIKFYTNSLDNISNTLSDIEKLPNDLTSVIWLSGDTGNSQIEFNDFDLCKKTMEVNFNNVIYL